MFLFSPHEPSALAVSATPFPALPHPGGGRIFAALGSLFDVRKGLYSGKTKAIIGTAMATMMISSGSPMRQ